MIKVSPINIILLGCALFFVIHPVSAIDIIAPATLYDPGYYRLVNDVSNCNTNCIVIKGSGITLDGNGHTISGVTGYPIPIADWYDSISGVSVDSYQTNNTIKNLKIKKFDIGIGSKVSALFDKLQIINCEIDGNGNNIRLVNPKNLVIQGNSINGSDYGIFIYSQVSEDPGYTYLISQNSITSNNNGIYSATNNPKITIDSNIIKNNINAIRVTSDNGTIYKNTITNNGKGLSLFGNKNLIYNNLFNNSVNIRSVQSSDGNSWNIAKTPGLNILGGSSLAGNVWMQPDGKGISQISPDSNGDGICDAAYTISSGNIDYLPLKAGVIIPPTTIPTTKPTPTPSPKPTSTPTATPTSTPVPTPSPTLTPTLTPTVTSTQTPSPTPTPTPSLTVTPTPTPTPNPSGPLKANFNANPKTGATPLLVSFQDLSTGIPTSWSWTFGDGSISTDQNPTHTYSKAGIFSVKLKVSDSVGSYGLSRTGYITVSSGPVPTPTDTPTPTPTPPPSNPVIVIDQSSSAVTQAVDTTASYSPFSVTNQGGAALTYTINEQASWLSISSGASGTVSPNGKSQVGVQVDTHGLSKGHSYWAVFTVANNDPLQDTIPLLFRVTVS